MNSAHFKFSNWELILWARHLQAKGSQFSVEYSKSLKNVTKALAIWQGGGRGWIKDRGFRMHQGYIKPQGKKMFNWY